MTPTTSPADFGRVESDGTVYVLTADGERVVGQVPDVSPAEAMAFYTRRYEMLEVEVRLLENRVQAGTASPDEARHSIANLKKNVATANVVGDLAALLTRLDALAPALAVRSEARKAERSQQLEATKAAKEAMVAEAEKLAEGNDWRGGVVRFRTLLDEWKALPRIDRATDDALWHQFSTARTTYTRRRKAQFAEQTAKRDAAQAAKEAIIAEARVLAASTDWGATAGAFRDLMTRWKAAGAASREADDALWAEFRAIQDQFFSTRQNVLTEQDSAFKGNLIAKEALLTDAEASILPVKDPVAARAAFRSFLERFNALGKVPRESIRPLETRVKALESAVREAEEEKWRKSDPEARRRAGETVAMLEAEISKLTERAAKATARGDKAAATKATDSIATYTTWLDQARKTLADFAS